jgi:hypothetical protein
VTIRRVSLVVLASLMGGCPYVSRADLEEQLQLRDDDGDGVSVGAGDCDDGNDKVAPGNDEIPYDSLDNDCVDGDLTDVDGDGFDLGLDCDDNDASVRPDAPNEPYDGVESDCRHEHDYDLDGDGVTVAGIDDAVIEAYERANDQPTLARGDCDDLDRSVFPGAPGDVFYDGKDTDCDGAHDFDQDGDGYVLPDDVNGTSPRYDRYIEEFGLPDVPESEWDCDDLDPAVNPGVLDDAWHDGIDANCDGADDFDADLDGSPFPLDCLDEPDEARPDVDPAAVAPGAFERLNDYDMDCRGDGDDTAWRDDGLIFEGARSLRIAQVDGRFFLGVLADSIEIPPAPKQDASGFALLAFDDAGTPLASAAEAAYQTRQELSDSLQLVYGGGVLEVGISTPNVGTVSTYQHLYTYNDAATGALSSGPPQSPVLAGAASASVAMDLTAGWGWSCGDGALYASDRGLLTMMSTLVPGTIDTCFAEADEGVGTVCADGTCRTYDATSGSLVEIAGVRAGQDITASRRHGGVWTFIDGGHVRIEGAAGPGRMADLADAATRDGDVVTLLEDGGLLSLWHGPDGGPFTKVPLAPGGGAVVDVAVALSNERVFAAVLTDRDALLWATWAR